MHDSSQTHREIVAAVASLKSCLRSVILAVSPPATPASTTSDTRIQGSIQRANDAVTKLQGLLSAVADQTLRLPLETSTRLVDVGIPDLLQQLLCACQINAQWPQSAAQPQTATCNNAAAADGGEIIPNDPAAATAGIAAAANPEAAATLQSCTSAPAALHPSWVAVQELLQAVFSTLSVLTSVLIRACTRSPDPAMVLMQLASPAVMEAQVAYMQQLRQHAQLQDTTAASGPEDVLAAQSIQCAPACVAAFTSIYGLLAAATDAQAGLSELRLQLTSSLCSTQLLPVAAELLLLVPRIMPAEQQQSQQVEADCQAAGWSFLTLALFLSGAGISVSPTASTPATVLPGQPLPSSLLAASIRADAAEQAQQPQDLAAAFSSAAADSPAGVLQEQLLSPPVQTLLLERLYHCVTELRGSYGSSSSSLAQQQRDLRQAGAAARQMLLPGRCCPADQDVLHAALRALRCWRALMMSPAATKLPISSSYGVQLLLTLLSGALAEPIRSGSSERAALRGRVIRVVVHCLQLLCPCLSQEVLLQQLPALAAALAGVVSTAGVYWDSNKRAIKSESLPYTGQVRCVDKTTGDMMVRYTMAAQSALDLLRQLLVTGSLAASGDTVASVMLSAGVLPAVEQLFRQLPVVSPAHVTASALLVDLLPACISAELTAGQLPLLATLRKFVIKSAGLPEPDKSAAMAASTQVAALMGALAAAHHHAYHSASGGVQSPASVLLQHAAVQLLPALQVFVSAVLKAPIPAPYSTTVSSCSVAATAAALTSSGGAAAPPARTHLLPVLLATYKQLAGLAQAVPQLQLGPVLLSSQVLPTIAEVMGSNYWLLPGFVAAAGTTSRGSGGHQSPAGLVAIERSNGPDALSSSSSYQGFMFSGEYAAQLCVQIAEDLLASGAGVAPLGLTAQAGTADATGMTASCSSDCLCAVMRSEGSETCRIGNPKCGNNGWCCCGSPRACSDITPPVSPPTCTSVPPASGVGAVTSSMLAGGAGAQQLQWQQGGAASQQLLLVLLGLLQSRVLPEVQRVLQQLSVPAGAAALESSWTGKAGCSRPSSATGHSLTVNVPARRGSLQRDARGASPRGMSPKGYSPLGHSAPGGVGLASSLRSQGSATQSFLSAYMGEHQAPVPSASSNSSTIASGLRLTAGGASRFASTGSAGAAAAPAAAAVSGSSPRYDDGAFGLIRAGSSGSTINWTAGTSLLQEAGVHVVVRDSSSGFGSSPTLSSLMSPQAGAEREASIFLTSDGLGAVCESSAAAAADSSTAQLQQRLEALLLSAAQCTLALGDAGMLGGEQMQRASSASAAGAAAELGSAHGTPGPVTFSTGSSPTGSTGFGMWPRPLSGMGSGSAAALYSSYLQGTSGPRTSFSSSAPYGVISTEEVMAGIRSCLAAAGAAVLFPLAVVTTAAAGATEDQWGASLEQLGSGGAAGVQLSTQGSSGSSPKASEAEAAAVRSLSAEASSDVIFPVELGLSRLNISAEPLSENAGAGPVAPTAPPCTPATPAVLVAQRSSGPVTVVGGTASARMLPCLALSADVLRRLQGALSAAAPLLSRHACPVECEVLCPQVVLAQLSPLPLGCWNPSCTNMPGVSESAAPSKPCASCKLASFCSKACEKKAWPEHTLACSKLAALAAAVPVDAA